MEIAVLYIATGPYKIFWKDFYRSSESKFIITLEKHYFIFTDDPNIESAKNVTIVNKSFDGFPLDSLLRFKLFLSIKEELKNFKYIFFFNSNMIFLDLVTDEFLPNESEQDNGLLGVLHPGHFDRNFFWYPYERKRKSAAFIPYLRHKKYHYFMGGVNGGLALNFLELCESCNRNIEKDLNSNYVARYHDESHLNAYFFKNRCKIMGPEYGWIEGKRSTKKIYIEIRDKVRYNKSFKKQSSNIFVRIRNLCQHTLDSVIWFFK